MTVITLDRYRKRIVVPKLSELPCGQWHDVPEAVETENRPDGEVWIIWDQDTDAPHVIDRIERLGRRTVAWNGWAMLHTPAMFVRLPEPPLPWRYAA